MMIKHHCCANPNCPGVLPEEIIRIDEDSIPSSMELTFPGGKLHGLTITEAELNYHGSITIDADLLETSSLLPGEFVNIWSKSAMSRISTYIIPGTRGSGTVCLNGGAARYFAPGDQAIITSERRIQLKDLTEYTSKIVTFHPRHEAEKACQGFNKIFEIMSYTFSRVPKVGYKFELKSLEKRDVNGNVMEINGSPITRYVK